MKSTFSQFVNANMQASLESQTDIIDMAPAPVDALELVDDMRQLREVEGDIEAQQERVVALEALVTGLSQQSGPMTTVELSMMHLLVKRSNATIPSTMGMGMEAYTGNRHGMMRRVALESFTEQLKKAVDWLIELLVKLGEWLVKVLENQEGRTRELLTYLKSYDDSKRAAPQGNQHYAVDSAVRSLSVEGRFNPNLVLQNVHGVVRAIADHNFQAAVAGYQATVLEAIRPFGEAGENWRSHVDGVNKISPPIPHGFSVQSQDVELAEFASIPMYNGDRVVLQTVAGANNHGARGAKARAQALSKAGQVTIMGSRHQAEGNPRMAVKQLGHQGAVALIPQAISLLEESSSMIRSASATAGQMRANSAQLKSAAGIGETHSVPEVTAIVAQLLTSVGQVAKMNGRLANYAARMANNTVNMFVHLLAIRFE